MIVESCGTGEPREYRALVAAQGTALQEGFADIVKKLRSTPEALPAAHFLDKTRSFGFRLLSRLGCALHVLLRVPHSGHPYSLFKILLGESPTGPECLRDELADAFYRRWPPETSDFSADSEPVAILQVLADIVEVDIAQIEAKHAAVRRLALKKSLQTWTADFQQLAAEWTCRQVGALRMPVPEDGNTAAASAVEPRQRPGGSGRKGRGHGGGGGPFRAFMHERYQGRRPSAALNKEAADAYRALSPEEMEHFKDLGARGTAAWRAGFPAFGERRTPTVQAEADQPGLLSPSGAIILADRPDRLSRPDLGPIVFAQNNFKEDLARITSLTRSASAKKSRAHRDQLQALAFAERSAVQACAAAAVFPGAAASDTFSAGHQGGHASVTHLKWFPPCVEMTKAIWCRV